MRFVVRRVAGAVPLLVLVTFLCFSMLQVLPGSPVTAILGTGASDPAKVQAVRSELGLDRPFLAQYVSWLGRFVRGDLGTLYNSGAGETVGGVISRRFPATVELALAALLLALIIAVPLGVLAAYRAGSAIDRSIGIVSYATMSAPGFVVGPLLIYVFGVRLRLFPVGQLPPWRDGLTDHLRSLVLPALTLAVTQIPNFTRVLRSDMVTTLQEDFIAMARSKGLSDRQVLVRHAMRPSSLTLLTIAGVNLGGLLGGAVIVEVLFNINGLGSALVTGIGLREYLLVLGIVAVITVVVLVIATVIDVVYPFLDPRARLR